MTDVQSICITIAVCWLLTVLLAAYIVYTKPKVSVALGAKNITVETKSNETE